MRPFGDLEALIMDALWSADSARSVREVQETLRGERDYAYTTVLTVVDNLFKKGWLSREPDGRAFRYRPVTSRGEYGAQMMRDVLTDVSDPAEVLTLFVGQMSAAQADALRAALDSHEKRTAR